jgi:hypothetical protein
MVSTDMLVLNRKEKKKKEKHARIQRRKINWNV